MNLCGGFKPPPPRLSHTPQYCLILKPMIRESGNVQIWGSSFVAFYVTHILSKQSRNSCQFINFNIPPNSPWFYETIWFSLTFSMLTYFMRKYTGECQINTIELNWIELSVQVQYTCQWISQQLLLTEPCINLLNSLPGTNKYICSISICICQIAKFWQMDCPEAWWMLIWKWFWRTLLRVPIIQSPCETCKLFIDISGNDGITR